jgi:hypothetical protein
MFQAFAHARPGRLRILAISVVVLDSMCCLSPIVQDTVMFASLMQKLLDLLIIIFISLALGAYLSPADPYSFVAISVTLFLFSLGSYLIGYRRGTKKFSGTIRRLEADHT